jgi:hypothetical protein
VARRLPDESPVGADPIAAAGTESDLSQPEASVVDAELGGAAKLDRKLPSEAGKVADKESKLVFCPLAVLV